MFQAGDKRWDMESYDCSHGVHGSKCIFEIHRSGETEYLLEYDMPKDVIDVSLDLEESDYFYWVSLIWNDSRMRAKLSSSWEVV